MSIAASIVAVLVSVVAVNVLFHHKLAHRRILSTGVYTLAVGTALYGVAAIFDMPIIGLRYGVAPEVVEGDAAVFAAKFAIIVGFMFICAAVLFEKKPKDRSGRDAEKEGSSKGQRRWNK